MDETFFSFGLIVLAPSSIWIDISLFNYEHHIVYGYSIIGLIIDLYIDE